jgi:hypothetical protein
LHSKFKKEAWFYFHTDVAIPAIALEISKSQDGKKISKRGMVSITLGQKLPKGKYIFKEEKSGLLIFTPASIISS